LATAVTPVLSLHGGFFPLACEGIFLCSTNAGVAARVSPRMARSTTPARRRPGRRACGNAVVSPAPQGETDHAHFTTAPIPATPAAAARRHAARPDHAGQRRAAPVLACRPRR